MAWLTQPQLAQQAERALTEHALGTLAARVNARIEQVHTEVACPGCGMPIGVRCVHMRTGRPVKHPHEVRVRAAGISYR